MISWELLSLWGAQPALWHIIDVKPLYSSCLGVCLLEDLDAHHSADTTWVALRGWVVSPFQHICSQCSNKHFVEEAHRSPVIPFEISEVCSENMCSKLSGRLDSLLQNRGRLNICASGAVRNLCFPISINEPQNIAQENNKTTKMSHIQ